VRATVAKWTTGAATIQRATREWLARLRRLKMYVKAVVLMQACLRRRREARRLEPYLGPLKRIQRLNFLRASVLRVVALRKARVIRGSFCLLKAACTVLGRWWKGTLVRRAFLAVRGAVALLQGVVRGMLARRAVARLRAARENSLNALALKRLRKVEGEVLSVALLGGGAHSSASSPSSATAASYAPNTSEVDISGLGRVPYSTAAQQQQQQQQYALVPGGGGSGGAVSPSPSPSPSPWSLRLVDLDVHHASAELYYYSTARSGTWVGRGVEPSILRAAQQLEEYGGPGAAAAILPTPRVAFSRSWSVSFAELPAVALSAAEKAREREVLGAAKAGAYDPAIVASVANTASPLAALLALRGRGGEGEESEEGTTTSSGSGAPLPPSIAGCAVGTSHTLALDDCGRVYSWGWGERGALGHPLPADTGGGMLDPSTAHAAPTPSPALKRPSVVCALDMSAPMALQATHPGPWTFFPPLGPSLAAADAGTTTVSVCVCVRARPLSLSLFL
jgi:hypothetical protein